jgi:hypothetical protein
MSHPKPVSLLAERAVRYLRKSGKPADSVTLARELLSLQTTDESAARKLLESELGGDSRLKYEGGLWVTIDVPAHDETLSSHESVEPDRVLVFIRGIRADSTQPFQLVTVSGLRLKGDEVIGACGGDPAEGPYGDRLRSAMLELLDGAIPVVHAPRAGVRALEQWIEEPLSAPISLRRLGRDRVGLALNHELDELVARLGLDWREGDDPLEMADTLDSCLMALRRPDEPLQSLRESAAHGVQPIDWSRYAFNREFLRRIPRVPGTYRFYDDRGSLLYVGKSKNLQQRIESYFREERRRTERIQRLIDRVHRIEYEAAGSDLEAMLSEAEQIRRDHPSANVQRQIHGRQGRGKRLRTILILEPAASPHVLRAFLIRDGRLLDRVPIGPRGGGLARIRRLLDDHYFSTPSGPSPIDDGPDLDVEVVVRWLAANRDRVVAFDPTDLKTSREVIERLRWFLSQGSPFDPDGTPILKR